MKGVAGKEPVVAPTPNVEKEPIAPPSIKFPATQKIERVPTYVNRDRATLSRCRDEFYQNAIIAAIAKVESMASHNIYDRIETIAGSALRVWEDYFKFERSS